MQDEPGDPVASDDLPPPSFGAPTAVPVRDDTPVPPRRGRWIWPAVAGVLAVALVIAVVLYFGVRSDRQALEDDLAAAEADLAAAETDLAAADAALEDASSDAEASAERVAELEDELDEMSATVSELEAREAELEAATAEMLAVVLLDDGSDIDEGAAACMANLLVEARGAVALTDLMRLGIEAAGGEDPELVALGESILAAGDQCGVDVAQLGSAMSYGDDPALDALYDACADGDGAACDELYNDSAAGSEYELFAYTCGERFTIDESPNLCDGNMPQE